MNIEDFDKFSAREGSRFPEEVPLGCSLLESAYLRSASVGDYPSRLDFFYVRKLVYSLHDLYSGHTRNYRVAVFLSPATMIWVNATISEYN